VSSESCPRCGHPLPADARFCPNCGTPVALPPASERRIVTVVFVDLAGSTDLAARLDPERFREVLAAFHGMVTDEVTALGGRAEAFIGDAVLGVFGVPVAHDDDAVRSVRAALAIVQRIKVLGERLVLPVELDVRVGIRTGQVAVGTPTDRNLVVGSEVNLGARLQQAARPGEILVGETTRELTGGEVEYGRMRRIPAKGAQTELKAWPVVRLVARASRDSVAFVDRRREIALLTDTFQRVEERERAHLVTLLGEPGIGKSRVAQEFLNGLPEAARVMSGRSSVFEEQVTFWPLAQMLLREIGEERDAPSERVLERLHAWVDELVPKPDAEEVARRLSLALGLEGPGTEENRYHAAEVRGGLLAVLSGLAAQGPVVLVFEEFEDADPLMLELVQQLVKEARRLPLLVVCVARWEFLQRQPGWAGGIADAVSLWVEPLSVPHAAELALGAGIADPDEAERIGVHAGGNPFFVVEIVSMLRRGASGRVAGMGPSGRLLPATVQSVIASRLDHLSAGTKELVRRASVFPEGQFDNEELKRLAEPRSAWLEEAVDEDLLVADEERPGRYRFRSDVIRDVVYESVAKRERQRLHLQLANELAATPELEERHPRTIAFHLEQAARASVDLNPRDRQLADRAVDALARAGDLARRRMELRPAADLCRRALALAGPEDRWDGGEAWIMSMLGEAGYWLGEFDEAEEWLRRALALLGDDNDEIVAHAARFLGDISLTIRGDESVATKLFERSLAAARRLGDPSVLSRTLLMAAWAPFWRNDFANAADMFSEALAIARRGEARDVRVEAHALVGLASVTSPDGDEEEALRLGLEALALATDASHAFTAAVAHQYAAASLRRMLRLDEALEHSDEAVRTMRELGARWELASALGDRGSIGRLAGDLARAEEDLREAFALCRDLGERSLLAWTAAQLARTLAMRGEVVDARAVLDDPAARSTTEPGSVSDILVAEAVVALVEQDRPSAEAKSLAALERERRRPGWRNSVAAQVWWTARLFGDDLVGGHGEVEAARRTLEDHHWLQALREPDLVRHFA
jgi:class 3 adenylate cyclase/tetratricopeptide (TPR) repeat protein